jgi:hypothetical protein
MTDDDLAGLTGYWLRRAVQACPGWTRPNNTNVSRVLRAAGAKPVNSEVMHPRSAGYRCQQDGDQVIVSIRSGQDTDHLSEVKWREAVNNLLTAYAADLTAAGYKVELTDGAAYVIAGIPPRRKARKSG